MAWELIQEHVGDFTLLKWFLQSPGLNPIEEMWDKVERVIRHLDPLPTNLTKLEDTSDTCQITRILMLAEEKCSSISILTESRKAQAIKFFEEIPNIGSGGVEYSKFMNVKI